MDEIAVLEELAEAKNAVDEMRRHYRLIIENSIGLCAESCLPMGVPGLAKTLMVRRSAVFLT